MTFKKVEVDENRLDFLLYAYFGKKDEENYIPASKRAYRDMCRTLRLEGKNNSKERRKVDFFLKEKIKALLTKPEPELNQDYFDNWHKDICDGMIENFSKNRLDKNLLSYGQAQKWLNMMMKYLYILGIEDLSKIFPFLHIPLDKYVFIALEEEFKIKNELGAWSQISDYSAYLDFQKSIREKLKDESPLGWELQYWLKVIKKEKGKNNE